MPRVPTPRHVHTKLAHARMRSCRGLTRSPRTPHLKLTNPHARTTPGARCSNPARDVRVPPAIPTESCLRCAARLSPSSHPSHPSSDPSIASLVGSLARAWEGARLYAAAAGESSTGEQARKTCTTSWIAALQIGHFALRWQRACAQEAHAHMWPHL
jgi:hypothetical protein